MCLTLRKICFAYTFFASIFKQQIQTTGGTTLESKVGVSNAQMKSQRLLFFLVLSFGEGEDLESPPFAATR
jgi:hypothetical protein